ncbi:hypothetical protein ADUPG1_012629 [Aduncisulcus paluster]|uniref:ABC transporter domain-containing protein n=1 Tax=Aduncisulcus paluster TaxID=2918883 RepID=A0ABQ5K028_9EUKA|nr:hypothetical protein ADUPG1_012629 [Aduncisulcus paluster]
MLPSSSSLAEPTNYCDIIEQASIGDLCLAALPSREELLELKKPPGITLQNLYDAITFINSGLPSPRDCSVVVRELCFKVKISKLIQKSQLLISERKREWEDMKRMRLNSRKDWWVPEEQAKTKMHLGTIEHYEDSSSPDRLILSGHLSSNPGETSGSTSKISTQYESVVSPSVSKELISARITSQSSSTSPSLLKAYSSSVSFNPVTSVIPGSTKSGSSGSSADITSPCLSDERTTISRRPPLSPKPKKDTAHNIKEKEKVTKQKEEKAQKQKGKISKHHKKSPKSGITTSTSPVFSHSDSSSSVFSSPPSPTLNSEPEPPASHFHILKKVSFELQQGDLLAVIGPSGCGKSTLLLALTDQLPDSGTNGSVLIFGHKPGTWMRGLVNYIPQEDILNKDATVKEVVDFHATLRIARVKPFMKRLLVNSFLTALGIDTIASNHIKGLSGGQKRRVMIASELVIDAGLLFADEPTGGLDSVAADNLIWLFKFMTKGMSLERTLLRAEKRTGYVSEVLPTTVGWFPESATSTAWTTITDEAHENNETTTINLSSTEVSEGKDHYKLEEEEEEEERGREEIEYRDDSSKPPRRGRFSERVDSVEYLSGDKLDSESIDSVKPLQSVVQSPHLFPYSKIQSESSSVSPSESNPLITSIVSPNVPPSSHTGEGDSYRSTTKPISSPTSPKKKKRTPHIRKKRTIISTLHRPSSNQFFLFDKIMVMGEGELAYFGRSDDVETYLKLIGFPIPSTKVNPFDYLIDLVSQNSTREHSFSLDYEDRLKYLTTIIRIAADLRYAEAVAKDNESGEGKQKQSMLESHTREHSFSLDYEDRLKYLTTIIRIAADLRYAEAVAKDNESGEGKQKQSMLESHTSWDAINSFFGAILADQMMLKHT